ncbi:neuronal acetylcholine receptor subunit alpha-10-like [Chroicocephalus ridibundus]|uniref:neuronal acetylcholine receptor subunit alpha-10-like n=1 Tax=Chroicocephalus ridibundus TaxID=1192867 RepID=UPI002FDED34C
MGRNQVLTSYLWVRQAWLDAHLAWDKDAYGGIDSIRIPSSYVWRPAIIILYNDADDGFGGSVETNVVLRSDGHITWDSPAITKSSCKVDVSYLPFDGQQCRLTFGSWSYNGNQIDLRNRLDTGDLTDFVENVEWEALGMPATKIREDLENDELDEGEKLFVDGSSRVVEGQRKSGYAIVDGRSFKRDRRKEV